MGCFLPLSPVTMSFIWKVQLESSEFDSFDLRKLECEMLQEKCFVFPAHF